MQTLSSKDKKLKPYGFKTQFYSFLWILYQPRVWIHMSINLDMQGASEHKEISGMGKLFGSSIDFLYWGKEGSV